MQGTVALTFYEEKYRDKLCGFALPESQESSAVLPTEGVDSLSDPQCHLVLMLSGETCVGYFILREKTNTGSLILDTNALSIQSLTINFSEQEHGVAFQGMRLLPHFVSQHFPLANKLMLFTDKHDTSAQKLYQEAGFIEYSKRHHGAFGGQHVFLYNLE